MDQVQPVGAEEVGRAPAGDRLDRAGREDDGARLVGDHDDVAGPADDREQEVVQRLERVGVTENGRSRRGAYGIGPGRDGHPSFNGGPGPGLRPTCGGPQRSRIAAQLKKGLATESGIGVH